MIGLTSVMNLVFVALGKLGGSVTAPTFAHGATNGIAGLSLLLLTGGDPAIVPPVGLLAWLPLAAARAGLLAYPRRHEPSRRVRRPPFSRGCAFCQSIQEVSQTREICFRDASAQAPIELRGGAAQPFESDITALRHCQHMGAAIGGISLAREEAVHLHRVEVVRDGGALDPDRGGKLALTAPRPRLERDQDEPHGERATCRNQDIVESAAHGPGGHRELESNGWHTRLTRAQVAAELGYRSIFPVRKMEGTKLHPMREARGWLFDPEQVAELKLPRIAARPVAAPMSEGRIAAPVFYMFDHGRELREIVEELDVPPGLVRELWHEWMIDLEEGEAERKKSAQERHRRRREEQDLREVKRQREREQKNFETMMAGLNASLGRRDKP
jgi:hypothetical protein